MLIIFGGYHWKHAKETHSLQYETSQCVWCNSGRILYDLNLLGCDTMWQGKWFEGSCHNQVFSSSALCMGGCGFKSQNGDLCPDWTNIMVSHLRTWWKGCTNPGWQVAVAAQLRTEASNICGCLVLNLLHVIVLAFWGGSYILEKFCTPA